MVPDEKNDSTDPEVAARRLRQLMMALAPGLQLQENHYWKQAPHL